MAAGFGSRMQPVTLTTPKPLVKVNGMRMIDTVIQGLHHNGIQEIYIVAGYLKEQFYALETQYPGVKIILDGDQIIYNDKILDPSFERSGYNCVWTDSQTDEWLMTVKDGVVTSCSRTGGTGGWQLYSISRWSVEDGRKLKQHLEIEFEQNKNRQIYWDDIAMFCYPGEYHLGIYPMKKDDIIEIDNLSELAALDSSYQQYMEAQ